MGGLLNRLANQFKHAIDLLFVVALDQPLDGDGPRRWQGSADTRGLAAGGMRGSASRFHLERKVGGSFDRHARTASHLETLQDRISDLL
jgi:hypothetical protein